MISSGNIQKLGQLLDSTIKHGRVTLQEIKENANYWDVDAEWIVDTLININFFIQIDDYYLPNPEKKNIQNSNSTNISKIALREIERVSKANSFITVDAWRNEEERENLMKWVLTAETYMHVDDWKKLFPEIGFTGDYHWFIAD